MTQPMTLTQKILAAHARNLARPYVQAGDVLQIGVDWTIASELAWNGMERTYALLGRPKLFDKDKFFLAVDHTVDPVTLASDKRAQKLVQLSQSFARESGIKTRTENDAERTTGSWALVARVPENRPTARPPGIPAAHPSACGSEFPARPRCRRCSAWRAQTQSIVWPDGR